jgi:hypothetical protein
MANTEEVESINAIACRTDRDKAYLAAHAIRALAYDLAVVTAREVFNAAVAAVAAATSADPAATAAATIAAAHKVELAQTQASLRAKYLADHAHAHAEEVYRTSIEKADLDYVACLAAA